MRATECGLSRRPRRKIMPSATMTGSPFFPALYKSTAEFARSTHSRSVVMDPTQSVSPHPLLKTRSPFSLPDAAVAPSIAWTIQKYKARADTYDETSLSTGPVFAVHHPGWALPKLPSAGERPRTLTPAFKHRSDDGRSATGLYTTWPELNLGPKTRLASASRMSLTRLNEKQYPPPGWQGSTHASLR